MCDLGRLELTVVTGQFGLRYRQVYRKVSKQASKHASKWAWNMEVTKFWLLASGSQSSQQQNSVPVPV